MGSVINASVVDGTANSVGLLLPNYNGLKGWFYPNGSAAEAVTDYSGIGNAVVNGAPIFNTGYTSFPQNTGLKTGVMESAQQTILYVSRTTDTFNPASDAPVVTNCFGADPSDTNFTTSRGTIVSFGDTSGTFCAEGQDYYQGTKPNTVGFAVKATVTQAQLNAFGFYAFSIDASGDNTMIAKTAGVTTTTTTGATRSINGTLPFIIGNTSLSVFLGETDTAFIAYYNRALTATEISAIYVFVQNYLGKKFSIAV